MEELRLKKIVIRSQRPHDLESFLVEVLGAEITQLDEESFLAEVAGVIFDVRPGNAAPDNFEFWVSPGFLADIASRWEFYCFRRTALRAKTQSQNHFSCEDDEGRTWSVFTPELARTEYPSSYVRNC